jgi:hypothetical protein
MNDRITYCGAIQLISIIGRQGRDQLTNPHAQQFARGSTALPVIQRHRKSTHLALQLVFILKVSCGCRNAMGQLMPRYVNSNSEAIKQAAVAIAENHLCSVPKGIVIINSIMNCAARTAA